MKCRSPFWVQVESSDCAGDGGGAWFHTAVAFSTVLQKMPWKSKEQPEFCLVLGSPGAIRVPVMSLRDVGQQQPHCMPKFRHLSYSCSAEKPRAVRSKGIWSPETEAEILLQPEEPLAGLQPTSAFPAGAAQGGGRANWWDQHMLLPLYTSASIMS